MYYTRFPAPCEHQIPNGCMRTKEILNVHKSISQNQCPKVDVPKPKLSNRCPKVKFQIPEIDVLKSISRKHKTPAEIPK